MELEFHEQLEKLDNIRKGPVINRKINYEVQKEKYNNVSIYYEQYVTSQKTWLLEIVLIKKFNLLLVINIFLIYEK